MVSRSLAAGAPPPGVHGLDVLVREGGPDFPDVGHDRRRVLHNQVRFTDCGARLSATVLL